MTDLPHAYRPDLIDNPEWDAVQTRQAELYIEDFKRRQSPEREPARMHVALGILAAIGIALSLAAAWL